MSSTVQERPVYAPDALDRAGSRGADGQGAAGAASTEEVTTRFLNFLIPAAASVASTFGGPIGQAIGGAFGGSSGAKTGGQIGSSVGGFLGNLGGGINLGGLFGGRSLDGYDAYGLNGSVVLDAPVDLTGPMVQQCTLECMSKITPELAQMLQGMHSQLAPAGGSRSAEAEIEALERFWPDIAGFLTQQVATHLPTVMKSVTSGLMPLLGVRETAQFTPLLTGTEANARWFLPILSTVLTTVQQNLPNLLKVLDGGSRAARDTSISWTDIADYGRFWDNDFIRVVGQQDLPDQDTVKLVLELAPHLSWAKEVHVRDDNGAVITRLSVRDATKWAEATLPADQILTNGSLLFAKAKMFGVMTGMYVLPTAGMDQLKGKRTHIRWMSD